MTYHKDYMDILTLFDLLQGHTRLHAKCSKAQWMWNFPGVAGSPEAVQVVWYAHRLHPESQGVPKARHLTLTPPDGRCMNVCM